MRRIIANARVSLDGVMQAPNGAQEDTSDGFDLGRWIMKIQGPYEHTRARKVHRMPPRFPAGN